MSAFVEGLSFLDAYGRIPGFLSLSITSDRVTYLFRSADQARYFEILLKNSIQLPNSSSLYSKPYYPYKNVIGINNQEFGKIVLLINDRMDLFILAVKIELFFSNLYKKPKCKYLVENKIPAKIRISPTKF